MKFVPTSGTKTPPSFVGTFEVLADLCAGRDISNVRGLLAFVHARRRSWNSSSMLIGPSSRTSVPEKESVIFTSVLLLARVASTPHRFNCQNAKFK